MSQNACVRWLVAYDISDKRNWAQVFKLLKKEGIPIQYSVFLVTTSATKMGNITAQLSKMIDVKTDDIRIYRIPENAWTVTLGSAMIPEDILIDPAGKI